MHPAVDGALAYKANNIHRTNETEDLIMLWAVFIFGMF